MNCMKAKPGPLQEQPISCYRVWMKTKAVKPLDRHGHTLLRQFLLGPKNGLK